MRHKIIIGLLILFVCTQAYSEKAIYVSPQGNDTCNGSVNHPLQTLNVALNYSRKHKIKTILIKEGNYYNTNIKITQADSGLTIKNYQKEKVTLYGAIKISEISQEGKYIVATLPTNILKWDFRMILINGSIAERSRLPEKGYFQSPNKWKDITKQINPKIYDERQYEIAYNPNDFEKWQNSFKNAEISISLEFWESYLSIRLIDSTQNLIQFNYPAVSFNEINKEKTYAVWNTREGLTHPGQWYWDKATNKIYYWKKSGENIDEITVPTEKNIILLERGAKNITIEGINLTLAANKMQNEIMACINLDAAISGNQISNILIDNVSISNTSANAIRINGKNISIRNTNIKNCGGGGIYFNGSNIKIDNCKIDSMGRNFLGAIGIQVYGQNVLISHCAISQTPYSAITIASDSTQVEHCFISHAMTALQDGAAIYSIGHKNVTVTNNYIVGNNTNRFTMGIYFDEESEKCLAKNNIVVNTGIPVHCHKSQNIVYQNNLFIDNKKQMIYYGNSSNITLNNNLLISPFIQFRGPSGNEAKVDTTKIEARLRKHANANGIISFQNNLLFMGKSAEEKTTTVKLPQIDNIALSGTQVIQTNKEKINLREILNESVVKQRIDTKQLGLTSKQINIIMQAIEQ